MKAISLDHPAGVRASAALVMSALLSQKGSLATQLPRLSSSSSNAGSIALLKELCYGACRWYFQLNYLLEKLVDKPLKGKDSDIHCLIILGMYQLSRMRIPDYVCINETVNACVLLKKPWAKALVNAVLRKYQGSCAAGQIDYPDDASRFAYPAWLVTTLKINWPDNWEHILSAGNSHPPMCLRVNLRRCSREHYLELLADAGIAAVAGSITPSAIYLSVPCSVDILPGFEAGFVSVQDEASQLLPSLMLPGKGQRILDACAAPGGKTCHLLETEPHLYEVIALDIEARRLGRLQENLDRLQLSSDRVKVIGADATKLDEWWDGEPFDRILLDAPCSATGIIRRQPDIKILRTALDIKRLTELQAQLLDRLWTCLRPGGLMVYSTCSILPEENSSQIGSFVDRTKDAELQRISGDWGITCANGKQLLPTDNSTDGFYFALLQKRASAT
ncbi:MAG: 16S rRNA (cytosine(967)-C(5))-methyltransferase RsmB [Pseudohongiella sp.]|nr:16S rRNA (cytosine(967)-C(5))-methyltransferase RsmB [Pseudohongiella sp.]